jgi:hypothetical protein
MGIDPLEPRDNAFQPDYFAGIEHGSKRVMGEQRARRAQSSNDDHPKRERLIDHWTSW